MSFPLGIVGGRFFLLYLGIHRLTWVHGSDRPSGADRTPPPLPCHPPGRGKMVAPHAAGVGRHPEHRPGFQDQDDEFLQVSSLKP